MAGSGAATPLKNFELSPANPDLGVENQTFSQIEEIPFTSTNFMRFYEDAAQ
jgi:hypothetical protein